MKGRALDNAGRTASAVQRGFVGYFDRVLSTEVTRVEAAGIARRTRLGVAQIELEKAQNNRREVLIAHTQPASAIDRNLSPRHVLRATSAHVPRVAYRNSATRLL